jgi:hypothetical protein
LEPVASARRFLLPFLSATARKNLLLRAAIKTSRAPDKKQREQSAMSQTVSMIGLDSGELTWVRMLVSLLRHPDPAAAELTRQALLYLSRPRDLPLMSDAELHAPVDKKQR